MAYRVQATWTVDGELKSYAPQFARTRFGASRLAREMERTLAHFPTLSVRIEEVARSAVAASGPTMPTTERVHLIKAPGDVVTACGIPTSDVRANAVEEIFALSDRQCEACAAAANRS